MFVLVLTVCGLFIGGFIVEFFKTTSNWEGMLGLFAYQVLALIVYEINKFIMRK